MNFLYEKDENACSTISDGIESLQQQMNNLAVKDYQHIRYIGSSSGMHLIDQDLLKNNRKIQLFDKPSWFVQKLNDDNEENVIMRQPAHVASTPELVTT